VDSQKLLSVGIDIGTSTTQCVFSRMRIQNTAPAFAVPKITIAEKEIVFRAPLHLTPLSSPDVIDAEGVAALIRQDFKNAGVERGQIDCGAVIITGQTARKQNARAVTEALAGLAGEFVVATAGPDLESILAGKGSGAQQLSKESGKPVMNIDIGGGTSNLCLFDRGEVVNAGCVDIGGRLLRFEKDGHTVLSYAPPMVFIAQDVGVDVTPGRRLSDDEITRLAKRMADVLEESLLLAPRTALYEKLVVDHPLPDRFFAEHVTFSGGVADCVYESGGDAIAFDDMGVHLGKALRQSAFYTKLRVLRPQETVNATVIGAGAYSMTVSGSTIHYDQTTFPQQGLPVGKVMLEKPEDIPGLADAIRRQYEILTEDTIAIGFEGLRSPSYAQVVEIARQIALATPPEKLCVCVMAEDMASALGQALMRVWGPKRPMVVIDGISLSYGDMIDIGAPLAGGRVLPVVVKTFAFDN